MSYIGKTPTIGNFQVCDAISVVNNQAAYTMQVGSVNVSPESANHMIVSLNGVIQKPTDAFTVSGSTITFASNLVTGDVINFIQILGNVLDLGVPSDSTVSLAKLTATGTKNSTTFLRGDNTFAAAGGDNTPAFFASKTDGNQTLNDSTATKVTFNTELYDTNSAYASNKFTVPSGEAGKYFFSTGINTYDAQNSIKRHIVYFYKNNSQASMANNDFNNNDNTQMFSFHSVVFDLSVGDYVEVYSFNDTADGGSSVISSSSGKFETWFSAYKLII